MILEHLTNVYHESLLNNPLVLKYIHLRGITCETIGKFRLGYSADNNGWNTLIRHYSPEELIDSGFFFENKDYFNGRIIFPIIYEGKVKHLTSRLFPEIDGQKKHLHQKGKIEIAINHDILEKSGYVFLTEGPFDCMTLQQNNISSIGTLGATRISRKIISDLYGKKVYICFDSETNETGQKASLRIAKKLMQFNIPSYIVTLPLDNSKTDVNSYFTNHTLDDFRSLVKRAVYFNEIQEQPKKREHHSLPPIMEVAQQYLSGRHISGRFVAKCIFHKEKTGSLVVYDKNFFCFGCGKYGNSLDLIIKGEELRGNKVNHKQAREMFEGYCNV